MTQLHDYELVNWDQTSADLTMIDGERWAIKPQGRLEALGYGLGRGMLNIAEVRLGVETDGRVPGLVRLAENYRLSDLPITDLDEAVASELAYSLWVRRRDTHAYNRAYESGIPIFFDHAAAFTVDSDLENFLRSGPDNGYVPAWRVEESECEPTTLGTRWLNDATGLAVHPIRDRDRFARFLRAWVDRLADRSSGEIADAIRFAGIRDDCAARLKTFLQHSQRELPEAAVRALGLAVR